MGLWNSLCLLHCGLAAVWNIIPRYQYAVKDQNNLASTLFAGHVGVNTKQWYLHSWVMIESTDSGALKPLGVEQLVSDAFFVNWVGTQLTITKAGTSTTTTVPQFELGRWFFIEIGSSSTSVCWGSLRFKGTNPYIVTYSLSGYFITEAHKLYFPIGATLMHFKVSTK